MGMSSAQVIRDCQEHFNPSSLFKPLLDDERAARAREPASQRRRRGKNKHDVRVKMGHGGTLDPLATGVLILGVGKGTKSLQNFLYCTKTYETIVLFGASTDTYDRVGRIIKKGKYDDITRPAVEKALESFRGKYKQMPPLYSALKMDGKPLYEYAREGKPIPREIETREVDVTELELVEWLEPGTHDHRWPMEEADQGEKSMVNSVWQVAKEQAAAEGLPSSSTVKTETQDPEAELESNRKRPAEQPVEGLQDGSASSKRQKTNKKEARPGGPGKAPNGRGSNLIPPPHDPNTPPPWTDKGPPAAKIRMTVTSGFYVRTLCHDLGEKLGSGAVMAELCRSRQADFSTEDGTCLDYDDLAKGEDVWGPKVGSMLTRWMERTGAAFGTTKEPISSPAVRAAAGVEAAEQKPEELEAKPDPDQLQPEAAKADESEIKSEGEPSAA
jgi:tRNA pseudouridine55 synthase